jgi:hypothetical protein
MTGMRIDLKFDLPLNTRALNKVATSPTIEPYRSLASLVRYVMMDLGFAKTQKDNLYVGEADGTQ